MFILPMLLVIYGIFLDNPATEKVAIELSFCNFELPDSVKISNASFDVIYSFEIGDDGRPARIAKVLDDYVGKERVSSCLADWRFQGVQRGLRMIALFRWQHGEGWVHASASGPGLSQRVKITGERCPYQRPQSRDLKRTTITHRRKAARRQALERAFSPLV
ncbi:MAG: hypothetical protein AABO57_11635 [Acidobacteriota bacterium]